MERSRLPITALLMLALLPGVLSASNISPTDKYAWGHGSGWHNYRPTGGGVTVYPDHLEGYAWSENLGWLRLGSHEGGGTHSYPNTSNTDWGVNNDGSGNLSGYAWSHSAGWINFSPSNGGISIDGTTGDFAGHAWSENSGWLRFKSDSAPAYKVALENAGEATVAPFDFTDQTDVALDTQVTSNSVTLSIAGTGPAVLGISGGEYQLNGTGPWSSTAGTAVHGTQVRVRHRSANNFNTQVQTVLSVGGENGNFITTTVASGTHYSGQTPASGATASVSLSGGGAGCAFTNAQFLPLSSVPEPPPGGYDFPHGLFDFTAEGCEAGGSITVTITYDTALAPNAEYWKYGPTAEGPDGLPGTSDDGQAHWYVIDATVAGNSVSFSIIDGEIGDDDLSANGVIVDQGGPGVRLAATIPTLAEWARLLLVLLLLMLGMRALRGGKDTAARC